MQARDLTLGDALDTLVNQFADPLSFFRELIQNALDAGSPEIDVSLEFTPDDADTGMMTIHVDDYGEGMDRAIIDTRLTRLFSSSKDGDFTKIGRFGIGFVSVFAIAPDAVCVDTSRGGECWRVLFHPNRTFDRIALDTPTDGTKIQIYKKISAKEFPDFVSRARNTVSFWCKHAGAEVRFDGEAINEPFDIDVPCKVTYAEQGTEVVAGYCDEDAGFQGFYNRGLTLFESPLSDALRASLPPVSFKINSRYLEHTLTRDNVLRDTNFDKASAIVMRLITEVLPERLMKMLTDNALAEDVRDSAYASLRRWLRSERRSLTDDSKSPTLRGLHDYGVFRSTGDAPISLADCVAANGANQLYHEPSASPLTSLMEAAGYVVVRCERDSAVYAAIKELTGHRLQRASQAFCTALPPTDDEHQTWRPLHDALLRLLKDYGAKVSEVRLGHLRYTGSSVSGRVAITQKRFAELTPLKDVGELSTSFFSLGRAVVVNADHATVGRLLLLAPREPELAAYLTAKLFFLRQELTPEIDSKLASLAVERRCRRLG